MLPIVSSLESQWGRERRGGTCDRNISLEAATSPLWQRFRDESKEKAQQHKTHHLAARYRNSKESEGKRSSSSSAISQKFSCRRWQWDARKRRKRHRHGQGKEQENSHQSHHLYLWSDLYSLEKSQTHRFCSMASSSLGHCPIPICHFDFLPCCELSCQR